MLFLRVYLLGIEVALLFAFICRSFRRVRLLARRDACCDAVLDQEGLLREVVDERSLMLRVLLGEHRGIGR